MTTEKGKIDAALKYTELTDYRKTIEKYQINRYRWDENYYINRKLNNLMTHYTILLLPECSGEVVIRETVLVRSSLPPP